MSWDWTKKIDLPIVANESNLVAREQSETPRFDLVTAEWKCDPPLSHSPIHDPRDCSAHVVLVNRGATGNGVLVIHYVGYGRAGNEYPELEHGVVIPLTASGEYVEIKGHIGKVPPLKLESRPRIEIIQG
jgi:hypothetical protein